MAQHLDIGVGYTQGPHYGRSAGKEAALLAQANLYRLPPNLILAFTNVGDAQSVLDGVSEVFPNTPIIGGTAPVYHNFQCPQKGVLITALSSPNLSVQLGIGTNVMEDPHEAVLMALNEVGAKKERIKAGRQFLLAFGPSETNGLMPEVAQLIRTYAGSKLPVFGGSLTHQPRSYQFLGDQALTNALVVALIDTDLKFGILGAHGYIPSLKSPRLVVTQYRPGLLEKINNRPAVEAYAEALRLSPEEITEEICLRHPLGAIDPYGFYQILSPRGIQGEALVLSHPVAEHSVLKLMEVDPEKEDSSYSMTAHEIIRANEIRRPSLVLSSTCHLPQTLSTNLAGLTLTGFTSLTSLAITPDGVPSSFSRGLATLIIADELQDAACLRGANERLAHFENTVESLLATVTDALVALDTEGTVALHSSASPKVIGLPRLRVGANLPSLLPENHPLRLLIETGKEVETAEMGLPDDRWVEVSYRYVAGFDKLYLLTLRDITERRKAQETLEVARKELDKAFALTLPNSKVEQALKTAPEYRDRYDRETRKICITEVIPDGGYRHVVNALKVAADLNELGALSILCVEKDQLVRALMFHDVGKVQPTLKVGDVVDPLEVFEDGKLHAQRSATIAEFYYNLHPDITQLIRYHHHEETDLPGDFPEHLLPMLRLVKVIDGLSAAITRRQAQIGLEVNGSTITVWEENTHPSFHCIRQVNLLNGKERRIQHESPEREELATRAILPIHAGIRINAMAREL